MKIVEIVPRHRAHLYDALVEKEAAIRKTGRGTYTRVGRKVRGSTRWKHKMYKGSVQLSHGQSEVVIAKVRANTSEDERRLLSSFLGFVDRHSGDHVDRLNIQYR
jgi:N6-adenosine-specific RNA methylase IME4